MDSPRLVLVIFLLLFLFFSPDSRAPSLSQQRELEYSISDEWSSLDVLNASSYGSFDPSNKRWLNITGLREGDGYAWDFLPKVQQRAKEHLNAILGASRSSTSSQNVSTDFDGAKTQQEFEKDAVEVALSSMKSFSDPAPIYQNVTSIVHGKWARSLVEKDVIAPTLNLSEVAPRVYYTSNKYNRNITGQNGDLQIQLYEQDGGTLLPDPDFARSIKAQMTIQDQTSSGDGWELTLYGVHYPKQGGILLSTTSEKFAGIFALPQLALSHRASFLAQEVLNRTIMTTIKEQEADFSSVPNPWTSSPSNPSEAVFPVPHCEMVVYLQQHSVDVTAIDLKALEQELRFPTGASMPPAPSIRMSALLFSPDCGFILESQGPPDFVPQQGLHLNGLKQELYLHKAKRCILVFASVICGQIFLLMRQMKDTSTPSTRSKISFYTIAMMALGDGLTCMTLMMVSMFVETVFLLSIATAFLSFLSVSFFGMQYLMNIWTAQAPERQRSERERAREGDRRNAGTLPAAAAAPSPASAAAPTTAGSGVDTLPLPVTASRPTDAGSTPVILPPDQDIDAAAAEDNAGTQTGTQTTLGSAPREISAFYSKFYFLLFGMLFLSAHATTWPVTPRSIYCNVLAFIYLSFWVPQIHRNVIRNCRKALRWEFIVGESVLRLTPIMYFYVVPDNILFIKNDYNAAYALIGWVWIQLCALVSQEILGPRFFVPNGWAPPAYDYHPILREDDDEEAGATMPIGFTQAASNPTSPTTPKPGESKEKGKKVFDCAICTEDIEVPVISPARQGDRDSNAASIAATTIFSRRTYMVTPCRHIFHSQCLEGWMRYRLQCPICRENLPPL